MSNPWFWFPTSLSRFVANTLARDDALNDRFDEVSDAFDEVYQQAFVTELPGQTSNAGKFVTTNGTVASWSHPKDVDYVITDCASVVLTPSLGGSQFWTLGASRTCTTNFENGDAMALGVLDGAGYTLAITGATWIGSVAPSLSATLVTWISLWKSNGVLYALHVGDA